VVGRKVGQVQPAASADPLRDGNRHKRTQRCRLADNCSSPPFSHPNSNRDGE
jgi:GH43 family beta-xylosidase